MYLQENLGALSGPLLTDDQVAKMTQAQNDAIAEASRRLARPLTSQEKLSIIAGVQRAWGLSPRFDEPIPGALAAIYQGLISFYGTALYRGTLGLPAAVGDAGRALGTGVGAAIGGFANGVAGAFQQASKDSQSGIASNISAGRLVLVGAMLLGGLYLIGRMNK